MSKRKQYKTPKHKQNISKAMKLVWAKRKAQEKLYQDLIDNCPVCGKKMMENKSEDETSDCFATSFPKRKEAKEETK